uniref:Uncharacterized protein n=1 Tax=Oryza brachyantha TaxID=4533 RepID=J3L9W1_ORYBR
MEGGGNGDHDARLAELLELGGGGGGAIAFFGSRTVRGAAFFIVLWAASWIILGAAPDPSVGVGLLLLGYIYEACWNNMPQEHVEIRRPCKCLYTRRTRPFEVEVN